MILGYGGAHGGGFLDGLFHPFVGVDHLVVMIAVGLLAALAARRGAAVWPAPAVFVAAMAAGGLLGLAGVHQGTVVEGFTLASVLVVAVMVAAVSRVTPRALVAVAAVAGLFHGTAHGAEMPAAASPVLYGAGFLVATAALHCLGGLLGAALRSRRVARGLVAAGTVAAALAVAAGA